MPPQHFVDQRLKADAPSIGLLAKQFKDARFNANRNEVPRLIAQRWTADAPHSPQLCSGDESGISE